MGFAIQVCSYLAAVPLQLLTIHAFLRGAYRRFPVVFLYILACFLTTAAEMPVYLSYYSGNRAAYRVLYRLYWLDEVILQALVYATVMSLLYNATAALEARRIVRMSLVAGALLFAATSFLIRYNSDPETLSHWMTPWSRDLNLCATILDLALWALLLASKDKDSRLLALSGSMGVMFTGEVIGSSLRNLALRYRGSPAIYTTTTNIGDALVVLSDLLFLFLMWQTFRREPLPKKRLPTLS